MSIMTAAEARVYIPGVTTTTSDTTITTLIDRADAVLARWCGFGGGGGATAPTFASTAYTEFLPGPGGRDLQLSRWPIVSITSVQDDPTETFDGSTYLLSGSTDYTYIAGRGIVRLKTTGAYGAWSETDRDVIKIVYNAGWSTIPEEIKHATGLCVAFWWGLRGRVGQSSVTAGDVSWNAGEWSQIPDDCKAILFPFRTARVLT